MKPIPWMPLVITELPFREKLMRELQSGISSLVQGLKLSYLIYGPIGVGKTSILLSLIKVLTEMNTRKIIPLYIDCAKDILMPVDILMQLLNALTYIKSIDYNTLEEINRIINTKDIGMLIELLDDKLNQANMKVLLILDHVEKLKFFSRYWDMRLTPKGIIERIMNSDAIGIVCSVTGIEEASSMFGNTREFFIARRVDRLNARNAKRLFAMLLEDIEVDNDALEYCYDITRGLPLHEHLLAEEVILSKVNRLSVKALQDIIERSLKRPYSVLYMGLRIYHHEVLEAIRGRNMAIKILLSISKGYDTISKVSKDVGRPTQYITGYVKRLSDIGILDYSEGKINVRDVLYLKWLLKTYSR